MMDIFELNQKLDRLDAEIRRDVENKISEINKILLNLNYGSFKNDTSFKASEYDIRCEKANSYPGEGWEYVGAVGVGIDVIIIWRMSRVTQAQQKIQPVMRIM